MGARGGLQLLRSVLSATNQLLSSTCRTGIPVTVTETARPCTSTWSRWQSNSAAGPSSFAVVGVGASQYKVARDDVIYTEKLHGADVNQTVSLGHVLMYGTKDQTVVGRPYIPGANVTAVVEEIIQDGKVIVFKKRRRKNSRKTNGHRQILMVLRVKDVTLGEQNQFAADYQLPPQYLVQGKAATA